MSEPFLGEISAFGFNFAPRNWAMCNGQIMSIQQNAALFAILGTTFGGNGQTNFALPNLQCQSPMHWGNSSTAGMYTVLGEVMGSSQATVLLTEMPQHNHTINCASEPSGYPANLQSATPVQDSYISQSSGGFTWVNPPPVLSTTLHPMTIGMAGQTTPHENMQPYLTINFCIAVAGNFPARN
jgi:Microcystin-dependent protein